MNFVSKEELQKLKEKISQMSNEEAKSTLSGYPHIDQPAKKYYLGDYEVPEIRKTVYQEVHDNNLNYPKEKALEFFKSKITFGELDKKIDLTAKSFQEYGVKKGDFVTIVAAGIPETVYSFYALSKIGAAANMMAYYFDEKGMIERINDCESNLLLVMDEFYPQIESAIKKSRIKEVVVIPTLNSSILGRFSGSYKLQKSNKLVWNQFIKDGTKREDTLAVAYEENTPLTMVYSSGTTGAAKGILLSNDSFQNSIYAYRKSGIEVDRGFKFYQIIPPWYSTGLSTSIHLPLASGSTVFMDPRFERDIFIRNIIKAKPNYSVAPTSMYEGFLDEKLVKNKDLSFLKYPFEGGEPLRKEVSDKIEEVFRKHNCHAKLLVGYGQCECGATITSETPQTNHVDGNVGIPLPGINLLIVDENRQPLTYGNRGEILADTPCGMMEYFKNPEATDGYFYVDSNGIKWHCTGDIGRVDDDGNLFIEGRASDYSIINGKKVFNFDIENSIMKDENVKLCDVIMNHPLGYDCLTAHIVFNDEFIKMADSDMIHSELESIQKMIYEDIQDEDFVVNSFKIRDAFPYAKSGKRDVLSMKEETDGFIILEPYKSKEKKLVK